MARPEPCPHRPPCPGCPQYGAPGIASAAAIRLIRMAAEAGCDPPVHVAGPRFGFRVRARLAVRGRSASPKLGIFQAGSHRIADIPRCRIHHPLVNRAAAAVRAGVRATGTRPYAERAHAGELRAIQVVVERGSGTAQLVLVGRSPDSAPLAPLAAAVADALGDALHSLWWNGHPERSNAVLGPLWHRWRGAEAVCERIGGAEVFFPPGAFGQSNLDGADALVARLHEAVPEGARVLELYAGCGPLGLGLLARSRTVTFVESAPAAVAGLRLGLAARPTLEQARAEVVPLEAGGAVARVAGAEVVIADPPRKGLDPALRAALVAVPPARLLYVSCDVDSLERDAGELLAGGRLRLAELVAFDLFPNTEHVETLARFERRG